MMTTKTPTYLKSRKGAVAPLMALLLPVLLLFCGIVVNIAYMQLNRTELRVATDAAARAAGRAFSEYNSQEYDTVQEAIDYAVSTAALNNVGAKNFELNPNETTTSTDPNAPAPIHEITFGTSTRLDNGYGRYEFHAQNREQVRTRSQKATAVRIVGRRTSDSLGGSINMLFAGWGPFSQFEPIVASTATQVDRDIALVLDRSGSMLEYKNLSDMEDASYQLYQDGSISWSEYSNGGKSNKYIGTKYFPYSETSSYNPKYYDLYNEEHFDEWEYAKDVTDRATWRRSGYHQYYTYDPAPRHSRWAQLDDAVDAFLTVLDGTDQEERVSLITFNSSASKDLGLDPTFDNIRNKVATIRPKNGTNISAGMQTGVNSILNTSSNPNARPYAAKTIIVLTDGTHTSGGTRPPARALSIVNANNVTIHTVTFTPSVPQASKDEMGLVADYGGGRHYHADDGAQLVRIFEEIANNLPTIITE